MDYYDGGPLRNVANLAAMGADRYGEKTAFSFMGQGTSYADLDAGASRLANVLVDHGVEPGDRVGLFVPNTPRFPKAFFGAVRAGAVAVPLNLRMDLDTLAGVVEDAGIDVLVGSPFLWGIENSATVDLEALHDLAPTETLLVPGVTDEDRGIANLSHAVMEADEEFETVDREYDDAAVQSYTSGTTGRPKGVQLSHRNVLSAIEAYDRGGMTAFDAEDTFLLALPLFHTFGRVLMYVFLYGGGELVLHLEPEGEAMLRAIDDHDVTKFSGVPAMYQMMLRAYREDPDAYDVSSLESCQSGAAPLDQDTRERAEEAWDIAIIECWAMTEVPAGSMEPTRGINKGHGCVGPPLPRVEMKLVDPETHETRVAPDDIHPWGLDTDAVDPGDEDACTGELAVRGDTVFESYHDRPEANAAAFDDEGWFYTGDVARVDEDGYFWMVDRADDMLIVGGENVYPTEVEDALSGHPGVEVVAVVGADHEHKGEAPVAFVVPAEGTDPTERELREYALERLAPYAHPRRVFFVDELPRSAARKVQRYRLAEQAEELLDGEPLSPSGEL